MKRIFLLILISIFSFSCATERIAINVGSYNIRLLTDGDAERGNHWNTRHEYLCKVIDYEDWDIFGAQEVKHQQLLDILEKTQGYSYIGVGRDDGKEAGEYSPVFYKADRIEMLESGTFWLSETPDQVGNKGWDARCPRICSWGKFKHKKSGKIFWFFNTHMDHRGVVARVEGAKLLLSKIKEMCEDEPVILTGDFNVNQFSEPYKTLAESDILKDTYDSADIKLAFNGTFNNFNPSLKTESRIDHVFVSKNIKVEKFGILTYSYWAAPLVKAEVQKADAAPQEIDFKEYIQKAPSDHYPLSAKLIF